MHTKAEECNQVTKRWLVTIMLTKDLEVESLQHHLRTFRPLRCQSLIGVEEALLGTYRDPVCPGSCIHEVQRRIKELRRAAAF